MKLRKDYLGIYGFDRRTGLNVLMDEVRISEHEWDQGPRHLSIALTNACELSCSFCYAPKTAHALRFDEVTGWCHDADRAGTLAIGFGGGEPTLHPRFAELCSTVHSQTSLGVTMTTHGHRFTTELSAKLTGAVDFIRVSMDGVGEDYEKSRGRSFTAFTERLRIIAGTAAFGINVIVSEELLPRLTPILDFAANQGARQLLLLPKCSLDGRICLSSAALAQLADWMKEHMAQFPLAVSAHGGNEMAVPVLPIVSRDSASREHLHIDAQSILRMTAFTKRGVSLRGRTLSEAIHLLREEQYDEDLVWIRN
jgi:hypothetical protein